MRESNLTNFCTNKLFRWLHGKLWATDGADESGTKAHIHRVGLAPIYLSNHWQTSTYTQNTTNTNGKHEKRLNVFIRQRSNDNSTLSTHIAAHHHIKNIRTHTWTGWNSLLALKGWSSNLSETNGWSEKVFRHFRKLTHIFTLYLIFRWQVRIIKRKIMWKILCSCHSLLKRLKISQQGRKMRNFLTRQRLAFNGCILFILSAYYSGQNVVEIRQHKNTTHILSAEKSLKASWHPLNVRCALELI